MAGIYINQMGDPGEVYVAGYAENDEALKKICRDDSTLQNGLTITGNPSTPTNGDKWLTPHGGYKTIHQSAELDRFQVGQKIERFSDTKLIVRTSDGHDVIMVNNWGGYTRIPLVDNKTMTDASLATTSGDTTGLRQGGVHHLVDCLVVKKTESARSGTWTTATWNTDVPSNNGGESLKLSYPTTTENGAWIEYPVTAGIFNLACLQSNGSSTDVNIALGGVPLLTGTSVQGSTGVKIFRFFANEDSTVRITKVGSGTLGVLGVNYAHLNNIESADVDTVGVYSNSVVARSYAAPDTPANDYAIYDLDSGRWGGSLHGGETNIVSRLVADGKTLDLLTYPLTICQTLSLQQSLKIDWTAVAGTSALDVETSLNFGGGGYCIDHTFSGSVRARDMYLSMFAARVEFEKILSPKYVDLTPAVQGTSTYLDQTGYIVLQNDLGQKVKISYSLHPEYFGSEYPVKVLKDGTSRKTYLALVLGGDKIINSATSSTRFVFE